MYIHKSVSTWVGKYLGRVTVAAGRSCGGGPEGSQLQRRAPKVSVCTRDGGMGDIWNGAAIQVRAGPICAGEQQID
jgi:hypothetical protein